MWSPPAPSNTKTGLDNPDCRDQLAAWGVGGAAFGGLAGAASGALGAYLGSSACGENGEAPIHKLTKLLDD